MWIAPWRDNPAGGSEVLLAMGSMNTETAAKPSE